MHLTHADLACYNKYNFEYQYLHACLLLNGLAKGLCPAFHGFVTGTSRNKGLTSTHAFNWHKLSYIHFATIKSALSNFANQNTTL